MGPEWAIACQCPALRWLLEGAAAGCMALHPQKMLVPSVLFTLQFLLSTSAQTFGREGEREPHHGSRPSHGLLDKDVKIGHIHRKAQSYLAGK